MNGFKQTVESMMGKLFTLPALKKLSYMEVNSVFLINSKIAFTDLRPSLNERSKNVTKTTTTNRIKIIS